MKKIVISTGGGDAPGLNAVIYSVVKSALAKEWEVYGSRSGYKGLLDPDELIRWRTVEALGKVAVMLGERDLETVRELVRKLLWLMNDESGGLCRLSPELIGEILVQSGHITAEQRDYALMIQKKDYHRLGKILKGLDFTTEEDIRWALKIKDKRLGGVLKEMNLITDYDIESALDIKNTFRIDKNGKIVLDE